MKERRRKKRKVRGTSKCDNVIRIKYNANECGVQVKVDKTMNDIFA